MVSRAGAAQTPNMTDFRPLNKGFGAMDVTKPYKFIGFGAMDVTNPYEIMGFGAPKCSHD